MKTLWLDLTDLFEWNGYFTGIQRVTYNYAARFHNRGAKFFVYSRLYDRFIEIPFALVEELKQASDSAMPTVTKRQQLKKKLRRNYDKLPGAVRVMSTPALRQGNKVFRKFAAMALDRQGRDHLLRKLPKAQFGQKDTILLLGAGWNSKDMISKVATQKQALDLKVMLHLNDILPVYQPHLFAKELPGLFIKYLDRALAIADKVTVISNATKSDVAKYCKQHDLQTPPILVIRLGEDITTAAPIKPQPPVADKFILCVGTFEIRKNYQLLYQTLKLAQSEDKELPQIIVAGRKGWLTKDLQYVIEHDPDTAGKFVLLENMSDANLSWLYENCLFTIFSSLAEGWGLPIAESLHHGKFCLSSNTSSMPEIAGDQIDYFNPYDSRECLDKILEYADKSKAELHARVQKTYKPYSWDASFADLEKIVNG